MVKHPIEPWFAPFALVNASALVPILLKLVAVRHGLGQVGLVMGAFYLGAAAWTWFAQALRERLIT